MFVRLCVTKAILFSYIYTVECESKVLSLLHSFLGGLDHLEDHCSPVMAAISLFVALKENSNSDQVKGKLKGINYYRYSSRPLHPPPQPPQICCIIVRVTVMTSFERAMKFNYLCRWQFHSNNARNIEAG